MESARRHIFLTGFPGVGKTTLVVQLARGLAELGPRGFFTREIRRSGIRLGFELESLDGRKGMLAHVDNPSSRRVGKYGVDLVGFEKFLDEIGLDFPTGALVVIDEIGKMECMSARFCELVERLLDSEKRLIATIAQKGGGFIEQSKQRSDVRMVTITIQNRQTLLPELLALVRGGPPAVG